jgi:hypothetical protein
MNLEQSTTSLIPGVSVIIPCYNYEQYIREAIESAINQTLKEKEVIVVDDGSTDNSAEIIKSYPVKYIYQKNQGLPAARNTGIKEAKYEKIVCLDADDYFDKTYIEKGSKYKGIVLCGVVNFGDRKGNGIPDRNYLKLEHFLTENRMHCSSMFDKKDWEEVGGFDEKMTDGYEDWEFWIRLLAKGTQITLIPELLFYYRRHGNSMSYYSRQKDEKIRTYIKEKHKELYNPHIKVPKNPRRIGGICEFCGTTICEHYLK